MRRIYYAVFITIITILFGMCKTTSSSRINPDAWNDATLAAEQRVIIDRQQRQLEDMGRIIRTVQADIGQAVEDFRESLNANKDLRSQFNNIDSFVRRIIEGQRQLEDWYKSIMGENAGKR